jgi:hypothetical protein
MEKLIKLAVMAWSEMRWAERFGPRMTAATACAVFAFLAIVAAAGCAVAGLWLSLETNVGPAAASLWVALVLLVVGGGLVAAARLIFRSGSTPQTHPRGGIPLGDDLLLQIQKGFGDHKAAALLSALLAGLAAGTAQRR